MTKFLSAILAAALWLPLVSTAAPEPIKVVKQTAFNPTLIWKGVEGAPELTTAIGGFLSVCGWFDVTTGPKADYVLAGSSKGGGSVALTLEFGGIPIAAWNLTVTENNRRTAKLAVDAVLEKAFEKQKLRGFCSGRIAFCAETSPGIRNIFLCDVDGGDVEQLTSFQTMCVEPCWFPDGKSIGYSKYGRAGMDVVQTQISPRRSRILSAMRGINSGAAISPDGKNLALILSPDHMVDLYVKNLATGELRRMTKSISVEASPVWSPDGTRIAYVSDETGSPRIFIGALDGSGRRQLPTVGSDAVTPDWSQDDKIVYAARVAGGYTLAVFDLKTNENKQVLQTPGTWESPSWAADNRQVVCKRSEGRNSSLYVVDTWTGKTRLLVSTPYNLSTPAWSPAAR